jgi:hypothetical protein
MLALFLILFIENTFGLIYPVSKNKPSIIAIA